MLNIENSFCVQYWEYILFSIVVGYFVLRLKDSRSASSAVVKALNDEQTIANDAAEGDGAESNVNFAPSLENVEHIPFKGASVTLRGGVQEFFEMANDRRSVRMFSSKPVDIEIVKKCIHAAGTSPSGAHTEPWTYALVQSDAIKSRIREIIEAEEFTNYEQRMSRQWTTDLKPLRTNHIKEYLTEAPYTILVFKQTYGHKADGQRKTHYYNEISCAISVGILLCALQSAGLSSLTTTPLNCGPALRNLLNRPSNEKLLVLLPVGYPADDCEIPGLKRKPLEEIMEIY